VAVTGCLLALESGFVRPDLLFRAAALRRFDKLSATGADAECLETDQPPWPDSRAVIYMRIEPEDKRLIGQLDRPDFVFQSRFTVDVVTIFLPLLTNINACITEAMTRM